MKKQREHVELDDRLKNLIWHSWCCRKCSTRGIPGDMAAYQINGIQNVEAKCQRCGTITRYPVNELD